MAHSKEKHIIRLEAQRVHVHKSDRTLRVKFPDPPASGTTVITAHGLSKAYGGPPVFEDVTFDVGRGDRLLVLGLNGAGKTSLLRILAGETTANLGMFSFGHNVNVGYYAQEHDNLQGDASLLDNIRSAVPNDLIFTETQLRGMLGMMGLSGEKVYQESGTLSGGEKTKLALAMLMVGRNNLLLLDEPTNNLDPPSRQSVTDSLKAWKGTIVFVSHDTEFVEQLTTDQGAVDARWPGRLLQQGLARTRLARLDARRQLTLDRRAGEGLVDHLEEVVALVVDDDERGEVLDLDLPDRLHAELGVLEHLDLGDAVLGQPRRRAADRAEVEAAVRLARVGDRRLRLPLASMTKLPPAAWNSST